MFEIGSIDEKTVARYIGVKTGSPDGQIMKLIKRAEKLLRADASPAAVYALKRTVLREDGVGFEGLTLILTGNDIKGLLRECREAVLLCATLGPAVDMRIRKLEVSDLPMALVYDAVASVAIDDICDQIQEEVKKKLPESDHTMRFSPGYGDLPLELQGDFLRAVNAEKRAGVSLTAGGMLTPIKTITAVFGLIKRTKEEKEENRPGNRPGCGVKETCEVCDRRDVCPMSFFAGIKKEEE